MTKKLRQKIKYLENGKRNQDEVKIIFRHFYRAFIEANKTVVFLQDDSPTLNKFL